MPENRSTAADQLERVLGGPLTEEERRKYPQLAFEIDSRKDLEYRYGHPVESETIRVSVNPSRRYDKTIRYIKSLEKLLKDHFTFDYEVTSEPEVHILGGRRVAGMVSVEMTIRPVRITAKDAIAKLERYGFTQGLEDIRG